MTPVCMACWQAAAEDWGPLWAWLLALGVVGVLCTAAAVSTMGGDE